MADYTRLTNLEVTGALHAAGGLAGSVTGDVTGQLTGLLTGAAISKSASCTLSDAEKTAYIGVTLTAASKTVTLGLPDGAVAVVVNEGGTNAFTLKNVSGDSGTGLAAGKAVLIRASSTANGSKITLLN